jgi:hypothetical protein
MDESDERNMRWLGLGSNTQQTAFNKQQEAVSSSAFCVPRPPGAAAWLQTPRLRAAARTNNKGT